VGDRVIRFGGAGNPLVVNAVAVVTESLRKL
jgi:hypothetical protein